MGRIAKSIELRAAFCGGVLIMVTTLLFEFSTHALAQPLPSLSPEEKRAYDKATAELESPRGRAAELYCTVQLKLKMVPKSSIEVAEIYGADKAADYTICYMDRMEATKK